MPANHPPALSPTQNEIQYLTPRILTDAAKRSMDFQGFSPRELDIYLTGQRDGMEAKANACHDAMAQFMDAFQIHTVPVPVA